MTKTVLKNIFRMPTSKEMKDAFEGKAVMPSDYQLTNLSVFASIMLTFRMVSCVPRSKFITVSESTESRVKKNLTIINNILRRYNSDDSVDDLLYNLKNTKTMIEKECGGINLASIVKDAASFNDLTALNTLMPRVAALVRGIYGSDSKAIAAREYNATITAINGDNDGIFAMCRMSGDAETAYEPSDKEIELTKKVYNLLLPMFTELAKTGIKPKTWVKRIDDADTFNSILNGKLLVNVKDAILNFQGTIGEFNEAITARLEASKKPAEKKYSKAFIDDELIANIDMMTQKFEKLGYEGGFTIGNLIDYIKTYDTDIIEMLKPFDIESDMFNTETFPTFGSLMAFFYEPERLYKATMALGINFRAREAGAARKGAAVAVDARSIAKCIKTREKKAAEQKEKYGQVNAELADSIIKLKSDATAILNKAAKNAISTTHTADINVFDKLKEALVSTSDDEYYTTSFIIKTKNQQVVDFVENFVKNLFVQHEKYLNTASYEIDNLELGKNLTEIAIDYPKTSKLKNAFKGDNGYKMMVAVLRTIKAEIASKLELNVPFIMDREEIRLNMTESMAMQRQGDIMDAWEAFIA